MQVDECVLFMVLISFMYAADIILVGCKLKYAHIRGISKSHTDCG